MKLAATTRAVRAFQQDLLEHNPAAKHPKVHRYRSTGSNEIAGSLQEAHPENNRTLPCGCRYHSSTRSRKSSCKKGIHLR